MPLPCDSDARATTRDATRARRDPRWPTRSRAARHEHDAIVVDEPRTLQSLKPSPQLTGFELSSLAPGLDNPARACVFANLRTTRTVSLRVLNNAAVASRVLIALDR